MSKVGGIEVSLHTADVAAEAVQGLHNVLWLLTGQVADYGTAGNHRLMP